MALIVLHHTVADNFDVDPNQSVTSSTRILQGCLVGLNSSGFVALASASINPLGIAGDSISDEYRTTAYGADLIVTRGRKVGSSYEAGKRWTSNRVSDFYNETLSSGKLTVYTGAGRFATDQYVVSDSWTANIGAKVFTDSAGKFSINSAANLRPCGYVVGAPAEYSSGVPGVDSPTAGEGSMSLGKFLQVQLSI